MTVKTGLFIKVTETLSYLMTEMTEKWFYAYWVIDWNLLFLFSSMILSITLAYIMKFSSLSQLENSKYAEIYHQETIKWMNVWFWMFIKMKTAIKMNIRFIILT